MQDIWKIVSTRLLQQDYDTLVEIARREGKTESEIIRLGIRALFQEYPMFDVLISPFTSKSLERLLPELVEAFIPILEKTIVHAQKEYNEAASINPKITRLKNKLLKEIGNVKGFEFSPFEIEEPKMEKPKGVINYNRLVEIIEEAGIALLDRFSNRNSRHLEGVDTGYVKEKAEKELVIREDLISQDIIIEGIKEIESDAVIYSEELNNVHLLQEDRNEVKFILDPLDGTHNFYFGMPYWGIGLAVLNKQNELSYNKLIK